MLEEPKKAGSKVLSHMLSSHGGEQMFCCILLALVSSSNIAKAHIDSQLGQTLVFKWNMAFDFAREANNLECCRKGCIIFQEELKR